MKNKNNLTPATTEVNQKLFHSVGISRYEIKQQRISQNLTDNQASTLTVEFLFNSKNSDVEKFNRFLKDLNKFIDKQNK